MDKTTSLKRAGWFSRRHKTAETHLAVKQCKEKRVVDWLATLEDNIRARAERSPKEQLEVLDSRLGENKGAKKERARLSAKPPKKEWKGGPRRPKVKKAS